MQAFVKQSSAPNDVAIRHMPTPSVGERELLVRVQAIGVGIHDGYFHPPIGESPYVIGIEAAGVVTEVGSEVANYDVGERIAFVSAMQPKGGTWAEYAVVADEAPIVRLPEGMPFTQAAAVPVAGSTILRALHALDLQPDESVFIAGASGAIGTLAIQLADARGCHVVASASKKNHDYMIGLGARKTVDYHDSDWPEHVRQWFPTGVDAAIAIQPGTGSSSMAVVRDGGRVVPISGDQFATERGIALRQLPFLLDVHTELVDLMNQIAAGGVRMTIENVYPFARGLEALQKASARHARGKSVLVIP
ncbi:MAG: NADP-dependent oxidoreductase [Thermomicrobiales bacterium]|nr:NADP-dependent oxidoreductase [Thermomicrobiales bacterium]